jgi:hypothetical protein
LFSTCCLYFVIQNINMPGWKEHRYICTRIKYNINCHKILRKLKGLINNIYTKHILYSNEFWTSEEADQLASFSYFSLINCTCTTAIDWLAMMIIYDNEFLKNLAKSSPKRICFFKSNFTILCNILSWPSISDCSNVRFHLKGVWTRFLLAWFFF